ncbi:ETX/MTX2 family pore-forming toxin [Bacillus sp. WL1]|uniref:ETX/MTX2 family pore-forming toxin n=1 Tax=Bacillus sp. WL1 TaxID=2822693 RepID=UPI001B321267|nr:ETX/MTX2 family pore-forming toxin [Bacillus sp. WL1]MBP3972619.1 ETX/MTX2 family pore-forming toxin [Bacillus sp. WL1]
MNKSRLKKPMAVIMLATSIGIPCVSAPGSVFAAEKTPINVKENVKVGITDVQSQLKKIGEYYYANEIAGTEIKVGGLNYLKFELTPRSVTTNVNFDITGTSNELKYDSSIVEYVGENTFENNTNQTQKYSTAKFTKSVTESITTATTTGFKVGGSGDGSNILTIPLLLNNGIKVNAEFNTATTESKTKSETVTREAPAQTVEVPPHSIYKAEIVLEQRNFWGDVTFNGVGNNPETTIVAKAGKVNAGGSLIKEFTFKDSTANYWKKLTNSQKDSLNGITFNNNNVNVKGTAKVEGIFGSVLQVKIYDITDKSNPKLVETRSFN